ncbi:MAG: acetolactate synthase [Solirubrobacterales bacterium]|nr:acetolactate synthase [Solirubrobacterales bacterium]
MAATTDTATGELHGGRLVARALRAWGVTKLFTLSGGHLFSIYDGCRAEGIDVVDVRHEQSAAFAAEGWAKVTRTPGVCALTAGPGVTNGMSAIAAASSNDSPMLVLGGRAPQAQWGQGALQEVDHVAFVSPLARFAASATEAGQIPELLQRAMDAALTPRTGPAFLDVALDAAFSAIPEAPPPGALPEPWRGAGADAAAIDRAAAMLRDAERPVIMAGTGLYWGHGERELLALAERLRIPVFLNGLGRGCVPADHELSVARARAEGLGQADVALVIGVPLDFRLGFGGVFADDAQVIAIDVAPAQRASTRALAAELYGALPATLEALADAAAGGRVGDREGWLASLRALDEERRAGEAAELADDRAPLHPMRIYGELRRRLDRDAIVIGDGGDFVSFAGRVVDSYEPGCWVDPGPYGCLGSGLGYALGAKLAHPDRQVVLLLGDGAFGFSAIELDTLVRHGVAVVAVMANNGIWALEKHPMERRYGWSVAADLQPETRYDRLAEALGCAGELVREPNQLGPALERAFAAGAPALINVLTDPEVVYPRRSRLA